MRFWKIKRSVSVFLSVLICAFFCLFFYTLSVCKLSALSGKRTFYLYSKSSQATITQTLPLLELHQIKGESVAFALQENPQTLLENILQRYGAKVEFIEQIGDSVSYYCYTKKWSNTLILNGKAVNLHIAIDNTSAVVGTPIIFGGF